jgi:hypothetical protein
MENIINTWLKGRTIPVDKLWRPRGLWDVKDILDNRLICGNKVVCLTRRPAFTTQDDYWYSFLLEAESTPEP